MFESISEILKLIQQRPAWETYRQYYLIQTNWTSVISPKFVAKTRPVAIVRQVLWVATESAAIAQHLSLQRYILLRKINELLSEPLTDIRFSSAQWLDDASQSLSQKVEINQNIIAKPPSITPNYAEKPSKTPSEAFQDWAEVLHQRSQQFPLCPRCQSPTELWELKRWSVCGYCAFSPQ